MKLRVFLAGSDDDRSRELLIRALSDMRVISGGYVLLPLEKADGSCVRGLLAPGEAAASVLPFDCFPDSEYAADAFISSYPECINEVREKGLGFFSPMLGDELGSSDALKNLKALLAEDIPLMGTIADRKHAPDITLYDELLKHISDDDNNLIINIDAMSDDEIISTLRRWAEDVLDWMHHRKFDPLMKLRARRRKQH